MARTYLFPGGRVNVIIRNLPGGRAVYVQDKQDIQAMCMIATGTGGLVGLREALGEALEKIKELDEGR